MGCPLRDWMDEDGWTVATLAPEIPVHEVNLRKYLAGVRPGWAVMVRLALISGGRITPDDWLPPDVHSARAMTAPPVRFRRRRRRGAACAGTGVSAAGGEGCRP